MSEETTIIAIDGPAGAGKSTIATQVAEELGFQLIDTGAIYRTVAYEARQRGLDLDDGDALASLAAGLAFDFRRVEGQNRLFCNGEAVGEEIRSAANSRASSVVSAHPEVRQALLQIQRELGQRRSSVLEGRDIGTVVFPDADVKIFLTATPEERARRRVEQMMRSGREAEYETVLMELRERDTRDSEREHAPLVQADDAVAIDSTEHDIDAIVARILDVARAKG